MRSPAPALVRTGFAGLLALAALTGCSKKTTAPGSRPLPEGVQNGSMLMTSWPEQASIWFTIADPATPDTPSDDFVSQLGEDYYQDPAGVRSATMDASQSNEMQVFTIGDDGNAHELNDFLLAPTLRFIGRDLDVYEFEDLAPGTTPAYVGRGAFDGVITTTSPVSNVTRVTGPISDNLDYTAAPKGAAGDSVLNVQFTEDPRAEFYVVEINDANAVLGSGSSFSIERRSRALPSPLLPGTAPLQSGIILMPAGTGLVGFNVTISSRFWPLSFYVRITAFDANGQLINRVNDYFRTLVRDGNLNLATYEPLGGAVTVLDPYPNPAAPVPVPDVLSRDQAFAILESVSGSAPALVTRLAGQRPVSAPPSVAVVQALSKMAREERFSAERVRTDLAQIRARLEDPAAKSGANRRAGPAGGR